MSASFYRIIRTNYGSVQKSDHSYCHSATCSVIVDRGIGNYNDQMTERYSKTMHGRRMLTVYQKDQAGERQQSHRELMVTETKALSHLATSQRREYEVNYPAIQTY